MFASLNYMAERGFSFDIIRWKPVADKCLKNNLSFRHVKDYN